MHNLLLLSQATDLAAITIAAVPSTTPNNLDTQLPPRIPQTDHTLLLALKHAGVKFLRYAAPTDDVGSPLLTYTCIPLDHLLKAQTLDHDTSLCVLKPDMGESTALDYIYIYPNSSCIFALQHLFEYCPTALQMHLYIVVV